LIPAIVLGVVASRTSRQSIIDRTLDPYPRCPR
jgi:hypothetical protein